MDKPLRAIGLMSGTSLDGIDAALIETDGKTIFSLGDWLTIPYQENFKTKIKNAFLGKGDIILLSKEITDYHADAVNQLLKKSKFNHNDIDLIGFHGQTIMHRPKEGITWQIGDGARLAELTKINVISDFRSRDVAAGGEGAPLVPLFHQAMFQNRDLPVAIVNIGGVANVTWIDQNDILAFDTGPGNALINDYIMNKIGKAFDENGAIAAQGKIDYALVEKWMENNFFAITPPKSLDRNHFLVNEACNMSVEDGLATLTYFTAKSLITAARFFPKPPNRWLIAGGGRHNKFLVSLLMQLANEKVALIEEENIQGDPFEAQAFGFLAVRSFYGMTLSLPTTTGCLRSVTGGAFYRA